MDNRIFNVNGHGKTQLIATLILAFAQRSDKTTAKGWFVDKQKGLVLVWHKEEKHNALPTALKAEQCAEFVWAWLESDDAKTIECVDWDADNDHDGSNKVGWRVYCEDWGHVLSHYAIVAIKPAYLWYGK